MTDDIEFYTVGGNKIAYCDSSVRLEKNDHVTLEKTGAISNWKVKSVEYAVRSNRIVQRVILIPR